MKKLTRQLASNLSIKDSITYINEGKITPYRFLAREPSGVEGYIYLYVHSSAERIYIPEEGCPDYYIGYDTKKVYEIAGKQVQDLADFYKNKAETR